MTWVVDSSVAVKWFVQEELREDALRLLDWSEELCAPDLIVTEVAGVAWKKCIRGEIAQEQAGFIATAIRGYIKALHPSVDLIEQALQIALSLNHSIYDCLYLACAEDVDGVVITADRKLFNRVKGTIFEGRVSDLADFDFGRFIPPLQIPTSKVEEIIRLWKLVDEAFGHLRDVLTGGKEFQPVNIGEFDLVFRSPNWVNLFAEFERLPENELADLLALGWLGQGYSGVEWEPLRDKARLTLLNPDSDYLKYACSLSCYLERGLTILKVLR